jgi:hypothetical protein
MRGAALVAWWLAACAPEGAEPARQLPAGEISTVDPFELASEPWEVPSDLLRAVAVAETGMQMVVGIEGHDERPAAYGMMALRGDRLTLGGGARRARRRGRALRTRRQRARRRGPALHLGRRGRHRPQRARTVGARGRPLQRDRRRGGPAPVHLARGLPQPALGLPAGGPPDQGLRHPARLPRAHLPQLRRPELRGQRVAPVPELRLPQRRRGRRGHGRHPHLRGHVLRLLGLAHELRLRRVRALRGQRVGLRGEPARERVEPGLARRAPPTTAASTAAT